MTRQRLILWALVVILIAELAMTTTAIIHELR